MLVGLRSTRATVCLLLCTLLAGIVSAYTCSYGNITTAVSDSIPGAILVDQCTFLESVTFTGSDLILSIRNSIFRKGFVIRSANASTMLFQNVTFMNLGTGSISIDVDAFVGSSPSFVMENCTSLVMPLLFTTTKFPSAFQLSVKKSSLPALGFTYVSFAGGGDLSRIVIEDSSIGRSGFNSVYFAYSSLTGVDFRMSRCLLASEKGLWFYGNSGGHFWQTGELILADTTIQSNSGLALDNYFAWWGGDFTAPIRSVSLQMWNCTIIGTIRWAGGPSYLMVQSRFSGGGGLSFSSCSLTSVVLRQTSIRGGGLSFTSCSSSSPVALAMMIDSSVIETGVILSNVGEVENGTVSFINTQLGFMAAEGGLYWYLPRLQNVSMLFQNVTSYGANVRFLSFRGTSRSNCYWNEGSLTVQDSVLNCSSVSFSAYNSWWGGEYRGLATNVPLSISDSLLIGGVDFWGASPSVSIVSSTVVGDVAIWQPTALSSVLIQSSNITDTLSFTDGRLVVDASSGARPVVKVVNSYLNGPMQFYRLSMRGLLTVEASVVCSVLNLIPARAQLTVPSQQSAGCQGAGFALDILDSTLVDFFVSISHSSLEGSNGIAVRGHSQSWIGGELRLERVPLLAKSGNAALTNYLAWWGAEWRVPVLNVTFWWIAVNASQASVLWRGGPVLLLRESVFGSVTFYRPSVHRLYVDRCLFTGALYLESPVLTEEANPTAVLQRDALDDSFSFIIPLHQEEATWTLQYGQRRIWLYNSTFLSFGCASATGVDSSSLIAYRCVFDADRRTDLSAAVFLHFAGHLTSTLLCFTDSDIVHTQAGISIRSTSANWYDGGFYLRQVHIHHPSFDSISAVSNYVNWWGGEHYVLLSGVKVAMVQSVITGTINFGGDDIEFRDLSVVGSVVLRYGAVTAGALFDRISVTQDFVWYGVKVNGTLTAQSNFRNPSSYTERRVLAYNRTHSNSSIGLPLATMGVVFRNSNLSYISLQDLTSVHTLWWFDGLNVGSVPSQGDAAVDVLRGLFTGGGYVFTNCTLTHSVRGIWLRASSGASDCWTSTFSVLDTTILTNGSAVGMDMVWWGGGYDKVFRDAMVYFSNVEAEGTVYLRGTNGNFSFANVYVSGSVTLDMLYTPTALRVMDSSFDTGVSINYATLSGLQHLKNVSAGYFFFQYGTLLNAVLNVDAVNVSSTLDSPSPASYGFGIFFMALTNFTCWITNSTFTAAGIPLRFVTWGGYKWRGGTLILDNVTLSTNSTVTSRIASVYDGSVLEGVKLYWQSVTQVLSSGPPLPVAVGSVDRATECCKVDAVADLPAALSCSSGAGGCPFSVPTLPSLLTPGSRTNPTLPNLDGSGGAIVAGGEFSLSTLRCCCFSPIPTPTPSFTSSPSMSSTYSTSASLSLSSSVRLQRRLKTKTRTAARPFRVNTTVAPNVTSWNSSTFVPLLSSRPASTPLPTNLHWRHRTRSGSSVRITNTITKTRQPWSNGAVANPPLVTPVKNSLAAVIVQSTGSTSSVVLGLMNPAGAGQAVRLGMMASVIHCAFSDDDTTPSFLEQPFQTSALNSKVPLVVGSTILTATTLILFPYALTLSVFLLGRRSPNSRRVLGPMQAHGVSIAAGIAMGYFFPIVAQSTALVSFHGGDVISTTLLLLLVVVSVVPLVVLCACAVRFPSIVTIEGSQEGKFKYTCDLPMVWETIQTFFDAARDPTSLVNRFYMAEDVSVSTLLGILAAIKSDGSCVGIASGMLIVSFAHFLYLALCRPFCSRIEMFFSILNSLLLVCLGAFAVFLTSIGDGATDEQLFTFNVVILVESVLFFVQCAVVAFWRLAIRHRARIRSQEKLGEPTESPNFGDGDIPLLLVVDPCDPAPVSSSSPYPSQSRSSSPIPVGSAFNPLAR